MDYPDFLTYIAAQACPVYLASRLKREPCLISRLANNVYKCQSCRSDHQRTEPLLFAPLDRMISHSYRFRVLREPTLVLDICNTVQVLLGLGIDINETVAAPADKGGLGRYAWDSMLTQCYEQVDFTVRGFTEILQILKFLWRNGAESHHTVMTYEYFGSHVAAADICALLPEGLKSRVLDSLPDDISKHECIPLVGYCSSGWSSLYFTSRQNAASIFQNDFKGVPSEAMAEVREILKGHNSEPIFEITHAAKGAAIENDDETHGWCIELNKEESEYVTRQFLAKAKRVTNYCIPDDCMVRHCWTL